MRFEQSPKALEKRLEEKIETIPTTALLRSAWILRKVLETWGDLLSFRLQWKPPNQRWWEKLTKEENEIVKKEF